MSDSPSRAAPPAVSDADATSYWCYHCNKRVSVETLANLPDVICYECKNGFVESIQSMPAASSTGAAAAPLSPDLAVDDSAFGSQLVQVLCLLAQAARDEDEQPPSQQHQQPPPPLEVDGLDFLRFEDEQPPSPPPPPPPLAVGGGDFWRLELNGWNNDGDDEEDDEEEDDDEDADGNEENRGGNGERREQQQQRRGGDENRSVDEDEDDEEDLRRRRREMLRLRIRDFASRTGRNRILDWAEILMGIEDNSIEFRFEAPESDRYIGNPGDYVDAAGYEALLQNLAESDNSGRRGAPPAAKSAVEALEKFEVATETESVVCAVCKDVVGVGETGKKMPCGHGYHCDCIVPWLGTRNSCPVCRFELPTDDPEYEEERKKRIVGVSVGGGSSGSG